MQQLHPVPHTTLRENADNTDHLSSSSSSSRLKHAPERTLQQPEHQMICRMVLPALTMHTCLCHCSTAAACATLLLR
jgi:hypothetical protein